MKRLLGKQLRDGLLYRSFLLALFAPTRLSSFAGRFCPLFGGHLRGAGLPPFKPPRLPSSTAAGFFSSVTQRY